MALRAGVQEIDITPPVGIGMTGFGGRPSVSVGIHDPLFAKCLVLENGGVRAGIVTTDLLSLDLDLVQKIRDEAERDPGIPADNLMLSSSHTHSGPATITLRGLDGRDGAYDEELVAKIVGGLRAASATTFAACVGSFREPARVGINRREQAADGSMRLGRNPGGPLAPYVDALRVDAVGAGPRAVLFLHAAHPVTLGGSNVLISADFPGYAMRTVKRIMGDQVAALFAQGCCGNINSDRVGGRFEDAASLGVQLAGKVVKAAEQIEETTPDPVVRCARKTVPLRLEDPPSVAEAEQTLADYRARAEEAEAEGKPTNITRLLHGYVEWAELVLAAAREGPAERTVDFEVQVIAVGDTALVALSGEVFVDLALEIDKRSPFGHTFVLAYTNGCIGYIPTPDAYPEGGYEVTDAIKIYGTLMWRPEAAGRIVEAVVELLEAVKAD